MIHVRMGNEYVREPQELACRQRGEVAEIEQQCASLLQEIHVQRRITERIVDQLGMEERRHTGSTRCRGG